jgi:hypothetical protein
LTFARLAPLPEGWTKVSWNERAEKKREAGKEILRAKVERDEGRKKDAPAPSNSTGKKRKQEDVAAVAPMPTKVHHHADEDEYSD